MLADELPTEPTVLTLRLLMKVVIKLDQESQREKAFYTSKIVMAHPDLHKDPITELTILSLLLDYAHNYGYDLSPIEERIKIQYQLDRKLVLLRGFVFWTEPSNAAFSGFLEDQKRTRELRSQNMRALECEAHVAFVHENMVHSQHYLTWLAKEEGREDVRNFVNRCIYTLPMRETLRAHIKDMEVLEYDILDWDFQKKGIEEISDDEFEHEGQMFVRYARLIGLHQEYQSLYPEYMEGSGFEINYDCWRNWMAAHRSLAKERLFEKFDDLWFSA